MKAKTLPIIGILAVLILAVYVWNLSGLNVSYAESFPEPNAEAVWNYLKNTSPYTQWQPLAGYAGKYPGKNPHGAFLKLFLNSSANFSVQKKIVPAEDKAMLVMENYDKDEKTLISLAVMYKFQGYNPAAGDWFWALYSPDGKAMEAGKIERCIQCHTEAKKNDWRKELPKGPAGIWSPAVGPSGAGL